MNKMNLIKDVRKELHRNPERSGCEDKTKEIIRRFLRDNTFLNPEDHGGGLIAFYDAGDSSDVIALRADFDAVSLPDGSAAHLCGHDGHTAAMLGVAMMLEERKPKHSVLLVFQPAEETGEGARAMAGILEEYGVSEVYGCHNLPGYEFGKVYTSLDTFACASCGMTFSIKGEPTHAAYPELGLSPVRPVLDLLHTIEESQTPDRFPEGTFATLIGCQTGQKAFGTAAEKAEVWVTVRSRTEEDFCQIKEHLEGVIRQACEKDGSAYTLEIQDVFPATVNHLDCAEKVLKNCGGSLLNEPIRWSEDFGYFLNRSPAIKGAFFGIGAGQCPNLHTKDYEYPDELLAYQMTAFLKLLDFDVKE